MQRTSIWELEIEYCTRNRAQNCTRIQSLVRMLTNVLAGRTVNELALLYYVEDNEWCIILLHIFCLSAMNFFRNILCDFLSKIVGTKTFYCQVMDYNIGRSKFDPHLLYFVHIYPVLFRIVCCSAKNSRNYWRNVYLWSLAHIGKINFVTRACYFEWKMFESDNYLA